MSSRLSMLKNLIVVFTFTINCVCISTVRGNGEEPKHWALLVAGSNGYYNYRHQADICHAYHVIRSHGIPEERIVVMMYDDIAYNSDNPNPGEIINEPNGPNVYTGVVKDYTKKEVTPDIFLKVLTGDEDGVKKLLGRPGKVIKSGPNDNIFVNFADHGATGLIAFPSEFLQAEDLNKAIFKMYKNKQYNKMVFYIEACESGSMFNGSLRGDINVFATTAANPDQSSYACYYDVERGTYLGDVYSVNWMQDSDIENLEQETLYQQYKLVKKETNTSEVMEYGNLAMGANKLGYFQGNENDTSLRFLPKTRHNPNIGAVPSEDVPFEILKRKVAAAATGREKMAYVAKLNALLKRKEDTREFFKSIVQSMVNIDYDSILKTSVHFSDFKCYTKAVNLIQDFCPGLQVVQNDHALRNLRALANLCETDARQEDIWAVIKRMSANSPICEM